ncbi:unnamed protein product, partial [Amoebophrya sp. A25]
HSQKHFVKLANQYFMNAAMHLRDAEKKLRLAQGFDRTRFLRSARAGGGVADDFRQDPEGFLIRKFFSCAAHLLYRRSVQAVECKILSTGGSSSGQGAAPPAITDGAETKKVEPAVARVSKESAKLSTVSVARERRPTAPLDPTEHDEVIDFQRHYAEQALHFLLLDENLQDERGTVVDSRDQVLLAELGFVLQHEKALTWIHKATRHRRTIDESSLAGSPQSTQGGRMSGALQLANKMSGSPVTGSGTEKTWFQPALYKPKLLLGKHYASLGNYNQALHHFKIAAKFCPEKLYLRTMR